LLVAATVLGLLAYRWQPVSGGVLATGDGSSAQFGRARAFAGLAFISGLVFTISGIVNASGPAITYVNPTPESVASVDRGAALYDATCARCHGAEYRGDGPDAGTTEVPPSSLISGLLASHSDSDLYTWIRDGLPGGMPGSGATLTDAQRWDLVNFLRGINGRGPSPDLASSSSPPAELAGFGLVGGATLLFVGWYSSGILRSGRVTRGSR
jgi:mono/diheme cytochrome c family protein